MKIQIKALDKLVVLDLPEKDTQVLFLKLADVALKFLSKKETIPDEFPSFREIQTPQETDDLVTADPPNLKEAEVPQEIDVEYGYRGFYISGAANAKKIRPFVPNRRSHNFIATNAERTRSSNLLLQRFS